MGKHGKKKVVEGVHVLEVVLDGETIMAMGKDDDIPDVEVPIALLVMVTKLYDMPYSRTKQILDILNDHIIEVSRDTL